MPLTEPICCDVTIILAVLIVPAKMVLVVVPLVTAVMETLIAVKGANPIVMPKRNAVKTQALGERNVH